MLKPSINNTKHLTGIRREADRNLGFRRAKGSLDDMMVSEARRTQSTVAAAALEDAGCKKGKIKSRLGGAGIWKEVAGPEMTCAIRPERAS